MRQLTITFVGLLLAAVALGEPNDRRFQGCIVFATRDKAQVLCASGLDISGNLACGQPNSDQMTEVSWKFLYAAATGDVYRVSRRARKQDALPLRTEPLETKEIVYSGKTVVVFSETCLVTIQPNLPKET